jgi:hypothetical protein
MSSALATLTGICSLCLQTAYFLHVLTITLVILCVLWGSLDFSLACNGWICAWKGLCKFVDEVEVWVAEMAMHHHKRKFKQMKQRYKLVSFPILGLLKRLFPCVPSSFMHWAPIYFLLCSWSFHCCLNLYPHALSKWSQ